MKLCINADDFGFSPGVNRGIFEAIDAGVVTSCSAMALQDAMSGMAGLKSRPHVSVGLHLSLTSGANAHLAPYRSPARLAAAVALGSVRRADLRLELELQYEALVRRCRRRITHIDSHHHAHAIPALRRVVLDFARGRGIVHVRIPREISPLPTLKQIILRAAFANEGGRDPAFFGLGLMGSRFTPDNIRRQLDFLLERGCRWAIWMVHPGYGDDLPVGDGYRMWRRRELDVLKALGPELRARATLVSMGELFRDSSELR